MPEADHTASGISFFKSISGVLCQKVGTTHPMAAPLLAAAGVRERSLRDRMLGRFRCLEALEEQPEGEQDDLKRCDGKDKDTHP